MTGERMTWAVFAMKIPHPRLCKQREPLTQEFSRPWMAEHVEVAGIEKKFISEELLENSVNVTY